jgi:hypothetical protein
MAGHRAANSGEAAPLNSQSIAVILRAPSGESRVVAARSREIQQVSCSRLARPPGIHQSTMVEATARTRQTRREKMSITLTPVVDGTLCHGSCWTVADEVTLAEQIARIALGQSRHVEQILAGANLTPPSNVESAKLGAMAP